MVSFSILGPFGPRRCSAQGPPLIFRERPVKRKPPPYSGVTKYLGLFETTAPPERVVHETPRDKREKRKKLKQEEHQRQLEAEIKAWDPHKPSVNVASVTTRIRLTGP